MSKPPSAALSPIANAFASLRRIAGDSRLRSEIGWSVGHRLLDFIFQFVELKLLTNLLTEPSYGEYGLATTALLLLTNVLVMPMSHAYLRYFHAAQAAGAGRTAGWQLIRWLATVSGSVLGLAALLSLPLSAVFGLEPWTALAAGLYFAFERFRGTAMELFEVQRRRRDCAIHNLSWHVFFIALLLGLKAAGVTTTTAALLAIAASAAPFAFVAFRVLRRDILPAGQDAATELRPLIWTFGLPYAALMTLQWVQTFADRYLLDAMLGKEAVGHYLANFQVCGFPYMLLFLLLNWLVMPVAYQRARDVADARQLASADRILIAGIGVYLLVGAAMLAAYWLAGPWLVATLTNANYVLPTTTIVFIAVGRYVQCLGMLVQLVFAVHQKMHSSLMSRAIGAALTVPICWLMIREFETLGAAIGTLIAGVIYLAILTVGPGGCFWLMRSVRTAAHQPIAQGSSIHD